MTKKYKISLGTHLNSSNLCLGCSVGGNVIGANTLQTICLILTYTEENINREINEPYCLSCALRRIDELKAELLHLSQQDKIQSKVHKLNFVK